MSEPDWAEERANAIVVEFMSPLDRTATLLQTDIAAALRAAASEAREAALRECEEVALKELRAWGPGEHQFGATEAASDIATAIKALWEREREPPAKDARGAGKE